MDISKKHFSDAMEHLSKLDSISTGLRNNMDGIFPEGSKNKIAIHLGVSIHDPSYYLHKIEALGADITHLDSVISSLKGVIAGLKDEVGNLTTEFGDLKSSVLAKAGQIEASMELFMKNLKVLAGELSLDSVEGKEYLVLLKSYYNTAMDAMKTLIKALKSDIGSLVNIDRLKRLWAVAENIFDHLPAIGGMVISLAEQAVEWVKTVFEEVQSKWEKANVPTKPQFLAELEGLKNAVENLASEHLPVDFGELFDSKSYESALAFIKVIPESIWSKATGFLNLSYLEDLAKRTKDLLVNLANKEKENVMHAIAILTALGKSFKSWLKLAKSTIKFDSNGKLLSYIKAKVTGGGDFGMADAGVDSDAGTGLTFGIDFFSITGAVAGVALLILDLLLAGVYFLADIY